MEKKEYLSEERYQKNKKRIVTGAVIILIIGLVLGGSLIAIGLFKQTRLMPIIQKLIKNLYQKN